MLPRAAAGLPKSSPEQWHRHQMKRLRSRGSRGRDRSHAWQTLVTRPGRLPSSRSPTLRILPAIVIDWLDEESEEGQRKRVPERQFSDLIQRRPFRLSFRHGELAGKRRLGEYSQFHTVAEPLLVRLGSLTRTPQERNRQGGGKDHRPLQALTS
jgi:hypothetical protein